MAQVYEFLGLTVGVIVHNLTQQERQQAMVVILPMEQTTN